MIRYVVLSVLAAVGAAVLTAFVLEVVTSIEVETEFGYDYSRN